MKTIKEICDACDYTYGYRRVTQALKNRGMTVNHKKVRKINERTRINMYKIQS